MALNIDNGTFLWQTPDPVHMSFEACANFNYTLPSPQDGSVPWGAVTAGNGLIFGGTAYGNMYALNQVTGEVLWTFATNQVYSRSGVSLVNNWMYWPTANGTIYAFSV